MTWCSTDDVRDELNEYSEAVTDAQITSWIAKAYIDVVGEIGRDYVVDNFKIEYQKNTTTLDLELKLFFRPTDSVSAIYDNDDTLVDPSDYTVDTATGKVTLLTGAGAELGDYFRVEYVPDLLMRYETLRAAYLIMKRTQLNTESGAVSTTLTELKETMDGLKEQILSKPVFGSYHDHHVNGTVVEGRRVI